jgi:hypothetical protein
MNIVNIYYGDFSGNASESVGLTNYFAANLGNSSWYDILSSYYSIVNGSRVYVHGSLTLNGSYNLFPTWRGNTTTISEMKRNVVKYLFDKKVIQPDPHTIYAVIFRCDFRVSASGRKWLVDWCGAHTGYYLTGDDRFYPMFFAGELTSANKDDQFLCSVFEPYPNDNLAADALANIYAHEVVEIITDPKLLQDPGWTFDPGPNRTSSPWENADECGVDFLTDILPFGSKYYSVQKNWQPGMLISLLGIHRICKIMP